MKRRRQIPFATLLVIAGLIVLAGAVQESHAQVTQVNGTVKLKQADGTEVPVTKGLRIGSEVTINAAKGSSAVVSLGKLGRVEVLPDTSMKLSYSDSSYTVAMLSQGRVRLSTSSGVNATVTTEDGSIVSQQKTTFFVDTTCGNTVVGVKKGAVELRAGSSVKQIAAGSQDTAGQAARPGCKPLAN
jgi:ferric-dicitrate binding protein FerR (iron transport regulator)